MVLSSTVYGWMSKNEELLSKIPNILWNNITSQNILNSLRGGALEDMQQILIGKQKYTISNVKEENIVRASLWSDDFIWMGDIDESIAGQNVDNTDSATMGVVLDGSEDPETRTWRTDNMEPGLEYVESMIKIGVVNVDPDKGALLTNLKAA